MIITENDIVSVSFHNIKMTLIKEARVLHAPCAPGDSWRFHDINNGDIFYISEGCTVLREDKKNQR